MSKWDDAREAADAIIDAGVAIIDAGVRLAHNTMARDWMPMGAEVDDIKTQIAKLDAFLDNPYEDDEAEPGEDDYLDEDD